MLQKLLFCEACVHSIGELSTYAVLQRLSNVSFGEFFSQCTVEILITLLSVGIFIRRPQSVYLIGPFVGLIKTGSLTSHITYFPGEPMRVLDSIMAVDTGKEDTFDHRSVTASDQH